MRRVIRLSSGALVLAAVAAVAVVVAGLATRSNDDHADEWRVVELTLPPSEGPNPQSPFTPQEQTILRHLRRGRPDPHSAYSQAMARRREREFDEAGGNSPAALQFYRRLFDWEPRIEWSQELAIFRQVARIRGDRSAFRKPAVERLGARRASLAQAAMDLLVEIAQPEDAAAVAAQFRHVEFDDTIEKRDHAYFAAALKILAKFGTEAEIAKIDQAKDEYLLWSDREFWAKAEACKTAIRERLAKEKEEADKK